MLSKLPPRERQIVDLLYERGDLSVSDICDALPVQLSGSTVRAMLQRLEKKKFVSRTISPRGYVYRAAVPEAAARNSALSEIIRVFFSGSAVGAASALLTMSDEIEKEELEALEAMIARARKAKEG
jgi:predicted transcriptional regulator